MAKLTNTCIIDKKTRENSKLATALICEKEIDEKYWKKILEEIEMEITPMEYVINVAKQDGIKQGIEQVAKNLKNNRININEIIKATGLTKKQIGEL